MSSRDEHRPIETGPAPREGRSRREGRRAGASAAAAGDPPHRECAPAAGIFDLAAACGEPGCPVCRCLDRTVRRHLAALVAEHVTDPETRRGLAESWGVCATHAAVLQEAPGAALAVAIVCEGLLHRAQAWARTAEQALGRGSAVRRWRALLRPGRRGVGIPPRVRSRRCPACVELARAERGYLDTVVNELDHPALGPAYDRSAGLCLPHLELACARGRPGAGRLAARTIARLDALQGDLRRFIDKHDHRARERITDGEALAWTGALAFLAGRPEVFGSEVPRGFTARSPVGARALEGAGGRG
jgi:hypothetical protein